MEGEEMKFILKHCEYVCAIFISIIVATRLGHPRSKDHLSWRAVVF